ncbi:MAG: 1,2-phenylacetyl-CoA epoxidase subunit PaaC [Bacteroidota bacterium]
MTTQEALFRYTLQIGDNALILGHRLGEWCGHGPILEQDIALTNIALDQVGQARSILAYAGKLEGKGRSEDDLAYLREERNFYNLLITELPNGNFADTIARQFFFDAFNFYFLTALKNSKDETLAAIAEKSLKEVTYHLRYSSEWVIRLGDGTEESHQKMQKAVDDIWNFTGEMLLMNEVDKMMAAEGIGVNLDEIKSLWDDKVDEVLSRATLQKPESTWTQKGGKQGVHTEHMGFILAEMQYLPRAYPGAEW